jgi:hypothetical protein
MMAFFSHALKSVVERSHRPFFRPAFRAFLHRSVLAIFLLCVFFHAHADDSRVAYAEIVRSEDGYVLNTDFVLDFNSRLADALAHGVTLYFVAEVKIERPRWYWLNEVSVEQRLDFRLAYHALTRSYRLNIGNLRQNFAKLSDALHTMQHIRNWQLANLDGLAAGVSHHVMLRFRHDTKQLPGPFQLFAVAGSDWQADTGWMKWTFMPGAAASR